VALNSQMTVFEFERLHPAYAFNFDAPLVSQRRVYGDTDLVLLPEELKPSVEFVKHVGSGKSNRNQTKTHYQCVACRRVRRNDFFQNNKRQHVEKNIVNSYCDDCRRSQLRERGRARASEIAARRVVVWRYIAPRCSVCGFDKSIYAIDMHHLGDKDMLIATLVTRICNPDTVYIRNVQRLLSEAVKCVPLCSNCHRMVHSGEIVLSTDVQPLSYDARELLALLRGKEDKSFQFDFAELFAGVSVQAVTSGATPTV